jgi:AcrR family transcriptional regulator
MLVAVLEFHLTLRTPGTTSAPLVHHDSLVRSDASPPGKERAVAQQRVRRRDPERGTRILQASAELFASRGYHAVGMADIGAAAGIVGSGIYRHFPSKAAILAELFARAMDTVRAAAADIAESYADDREALTALVRHHVRVAVAERPLVQVYLSELNNLAEEDRRRLRRAQRLYIEQWVAVVGPQRPELTVAEVRLVVHAAMGAIQSILFHRPAVAEGRAMELLARCAFDCLGVQPASEPATR